MIGRPTAVAPWGRGAVCRTWKPLGSYPTRQHRLTLEERRQAETREEAMPFPDSPRVIYKRNPLSEVICQVRFPPILRIDAGPPAGFQDRVRAGYPMFREVQPELQAANVPAEIASIVRSMLPSRARTNAYEFASEDGAWSITLTREWLALKTSAYRQWRTPAGGPPGFRDHLEQPFASLIAEYAPPFFTRIGLRYVDVIQRSKLGLKDRPWSELLKPHVAGELAAPELSGQVEHAARELRVKLSGDGSVMIRHGIAVEEGTNEACYFIDCDFFVEQRTEPKNVLGILDNFNREAGRLFRWCVSNALHQAMEPTDAPD